MYRPRLPRILLACFVGLALVLTGCDSNDSDSDDEPDPPSTVTLTIDNIGASAWVVTDVQGASGVATTDQENVTITLTPGTRYRIDNNGQLNAHPLALLDSNGDELLAQGGPSDGSADGPFEDDPDVNFVSDADGITFTLTQDLAGEVVEYICTFHPSMVGDIQINGSGS